MKSSLAIPFAIVGGGVMLAIAVYVSLPKSPTADAGNPALVRPVDVSDHIFGNPVAKVMIIEYSDFDCEFCKDFHETLHRIVADQGTDGDVAWVFREFPLIEIHPNALSHARAAECAAAVGGNDAFWKFSNLLFANQPADSTRYGEFAKASRLSGDAFATCYAGAPTTLDERILRDRQNALDIGAQGTPYSLILVAGRPPVVMNGAYPYDAVKVLVDAALAN